MKTSSLTADSCNLTTPDYLNLVALDSANIELRCDQKAAATQPMVYRIPSVGKFKLTCNKIIRPNTKLELTEYSKEYGTGLLFDCDFQPGLTQYVNINYSYYGKQYNKFMELSYHDDLIYDEDSTVLGQYDGVPPLIYIISAIEPSAKKGYWYDSST